MSVDIVPDSWVTNFSTYSFFYLYENGYNLFMFPVFNDKKSRFPEILSINVFCRKLFSVK